MGGESCRRLIFLIDCPLSRTIAGTSNPAPMPSLWATFFRKRNCPTAILCGPSTWQVSMSSTQKGPDRALTPLPGNCLVSPPHASLSLDWSLTVTFPHLLKKTQTKI